MTNYQKVFLNMTKAYVKTFPEYSFQIYFDKKKILRIGQSKKTIKINFDKSEEVFKRIFEEGSIGLGEVYCDGLIGIKDEYYKYFLAIIVQSIYNPEVQKRISLSNKIQVLKAKAISSFFTNKSQEKDINSHYSLDEWFENIDDANQFYFYWLNSKYIQYTCAKWDKDTQDLERAQINKFEYYLRRLGIDKQSKGKTLLDLGCGWGGFMFYIAEKYGLRCTGLTLSKAQAKYIKQEAKKRHLEDLVRVENINVHDMHGKYDYIVSVGLLEHIDDYNDLYKKASRHLKKNGKAIFHAMFHEDKKDDPDPFLTKYIFPGGCVTNVDKSIELLKKYFNNVDRADLPDMSYPKTIDVWYENFCKNQNMIKKLLIEKSKCKDPDFAVRVFKHYLMLSYNGLSANGLVCNILVKK